MIIHPPKITVESSKAVVSAEIDLNRPIPSFPHQLWFKFPERYTARLSDRAEAFVAAMVQIAMRLGEDIRVRGELSPKFAYGMEEYQKIFHLWWPELLTPVKILPRRYSMPDDRPEERGVAAAFSGGADSFYTLWSHLPQNQTLPEARVTHGLFIHGIDIPLPERENFAETFGLFAGVFQRSGLKLVGVQTNIRQFAAGRVEIRLFQGIPIYAAGLIFSPMVHRLLISSAGNYLYQGPTGNSPLTAHLFSTESLEVVHYGAATTRIDKLEALSNWEETYDHMRVCANVRALRGVQNCARCYKCLRTMTMLKILGRLDRYSVFPRPFTNLSILRWGRYYRIGPDYSREVIPYAKRHGKYWVIPLMWLVKAMGWTRVTLLRVLPEWIIAPLLSRFSTPPAGPLFALEEDQEA